MTVLSDLADLLEIQKREYQRCLDLKAQERTPGEYISDNDLDEALKALVQAQLNYDVELRDHPPQVQP